MQKFIASIAFVASVCATVVAGCSDADSGGGKPGAGCTFGEHTFAIGETFAVGCNTCTCTDGHAIACTEMACLDGGGDAVSDGGVDARRDVAPVDADDFSSFDFNWYGTGVSETFLLDRDCGVVATSSYGKEVRSGTVASDDCHAFEKLVTSPPVVEALSDPARSCGPGTDDFGTYTLRMLSGLTVARSTSGCSWIEPFATVRNEMQRLGTTYAHSDSGTADADAGGD